MWKKPKTRRRSHVPKQTRPKCKKLNVGYLEEAGFQSHPSRMWKKLKTRRRSHVPKHTRPKCKKLNLGYLEEAGFQSHPTRMWKKLKTRRRSHVPRPKCKKLNIGYLEEVQSPHACAEDVEEAEDPPKKPRSKVRKGAAEEAHLKQQS